MEIVSNRLNLAATGSPPSSTRSLDRSGTFSHPRKWNAMTPPRSSSRRRESMAGNSLMSLKAYYRKLRTFKGTIKALISFRRLPTFSSRSTAGTQLEPTHETETHTEEDKQPPAVVKLTNDDAALQTVQNQVKDLVEKGHVVTECSTTGKDSVAYRVQGNLEHYTEENLRKRVKLQEHPHMVALTQRLWLSAVHEQGDHLRFAEYEAYMLRLHRLILPDFDLAQSKTLMKDDWARDTDGCDELDYRFFHFSMFELVDLWTDTVEAEDYISLLYCIMHSLTFEGNGRHLLKDLDDINPIDILEASKDVTMEEIEQDLAREINGDQAQLYRDRVASDTEDSIVKGCEDGSHNYTEPAEQSESQSAPQNATSNHVQEMEGQITPRKPSKNTNQKPQAMSPRGLSASRSPSARKLSSRDDTRTHTRSRMLQVSTAADEHTLTSTHDPTISSNALSDQGAARGRDTTNSFGIGGHGPRTVLSGNQYVGVGANEAPPISIMSLGAGGEFINMVSKSMYLRKPTLLNGNVSSRQLNNHPSSSGDHAVFGHGLTNRQPSTLNVFTADPTYDTETSESTSSGLNSPMVAGHGYPSAKSIVVSSPRSPPSTAKESETRQGSLLVGGEQLQGSSRNLNDSRSPRARSAKASVRLSTNSQTPLQLSVTSTTDRPSTNVTVPFSPLGFDTKQLVESGTHLVGGGLQSSRMNILARPTTSSSSSSTRTTFLSPTNGLDGFLQTRAYQDPSTSPSRSSISRGSLTYHQRPSQTLTEDLTVMTLGVKQLSPGSPRPSSPTRPTTAQYVNTPQTTFSGSLVGSRTVSFEVPKASTPRRSTAKLGQLPSGRRVDMADRTRSDGVDLGLSGASARLSLHKEASATATKIKR